VTVVALLAGAPSASADVFGLPATVLAGARTDVAKGDFDRDGRLDVAVVGQFGLSVMRGLPNGGLVFVLALGGSNAARITTGDFNEDGDVDLAVARPGVVTVYAGSEGALFANPVDFTGVATPTGIGVGDFLANGDPDIAVVGATGTVQILSGQSGLSFSATSTFDAGTSANSLAVGDLDADGRDDLAIADGSDGLVRVWRGTGASAFTAGPEIAAVAPQQLVAADMNDDGDLDLVKGGPLDVAVYYGGPGATFPSQFTRVGSGNVWALAVADVNGDALLDAIAGNQAGVVNVFPGRPDSTIGFPLSRTVGASSLNGLVVGELTGDERPDAVVATADTVRLANTSVTALQTDAANLTFATQPSGTLSTAQAITVSSTGERQLHVRAVRTVGAAREDFVVTADGCTGEAIEPGGSCSFAVRFAPQAVGARQAGLELVSDAGTPPAAITLTGTGSAPGAGAPGPTGPAGPRGATGPASTVRPTLVAALATDRLSARSRKRLGVRFVSTLAGVATLELRRGKRVVSTLSDAAEVGRTTLTLRAPRKRGRYTLALTVTGAGQTVTDTARLTVKRRPA
jgi:hypothetical protein